MTEHNEVIKPLHKSYERTLHYLLELWRKKKLLSLSILDPKVLNQFTFKYITSGNVHMNRNVQYDQWRSLIYQFLKETPDLLLTFSEIKKFRNRCSLHFDKYKQYLPPFNKSIVDISHGLSSITILTKNWLHTNKPIKRVNAVNKEDFNLGIIYKLRDLEFSNIATEEIFVDEDLAKYVSSMKVKNETKKVLKIDELMFETNFGVFEWINIPIGALVSWVEGLIPYWKVTNYNVFKAISHSMDKDAHYTYDFKMAVKYEDDKQMRKFEGTIILPDELRIWITYLHQKNTKNILFIDENDYVLMSGQHTHKIKHYKDTKELAIYHLFSHIISISTGSLPAFNASSITMALGFQKNLIYSNIISHTIESSIKALETKNGYVKNLYVIGSKGSGKSTMIKGIADNDRLFIVDSDDYGEFLAFAATYYSTTSYDSLFSLDIGSDKMIELVTKFYEIKTSGEETRSVFNVNATGIVRLTYDAMERRMERYSNSKDKSYIWDEWERDIVKQIGIMMNMTYVRAIDNNVISIKNFQAAIIKMMSVMKKDILLMFFHSETETYRLEPPILMLQYTTCIDTNSAIIQRSINQKQAIHDALGELFLSNYYENYTAKSSIQVNKMSMIYILNRCLRPVQ